MDERSHIIEKLRKAAEKVEFEYERHIELIMEWMRQVDEAGELIKDNGNLINQLETKAQELEGEKHGIEAAVAKKCNIWIA